MALQHQDRNILLHALADSPTFASFRSRQTIVRNALGGYPQSPNVHHALRYLDWEGEPIVVADQLLLLLEGHEPAPGVAALGLIAQAIEPFAGPHRTALNELRRRRGWGTDFLYAPSASWLDRRPAGEVMHERIIGENTLRPMFYLRRALRAAEAVVRIDLDGVPRGTGFLIGEGLLMTNNHVIATEEQARRAQAVFFDELPDADAPQSEQRRKSVIAIPAAEPFLHTDKALDYTLLRVQATPAVPRYLPLRRAVPEPNQRVAIIQHAGGEPKRISLQNNMIAHADERIVQYYTSTLGGSSGSPVFDDTFAVVAIHHGWVHTDGSSTTKLPENIAYRNQGTSMMAVIANLEQNAPHVLAEMTILE